MDKGDNFYFNKILLCFLLCCFILQSNIWVNQINSLNKPSSGVWRYTPAKIQNFVCNIVALNYRSFLHSNIQLYNSALPIHNSVSIFQIQCGSLTCNIHIQCSTYICFYGVKCDMLPMQLTLLFSTFPINIRILPSNFFVCDIRVFQCNVDTWCVCCGAECDIPATQSNILLWTLNLTLIDLTLRR